MMADLTNEYFEKSNQELFLLARSRENLSLEELRNLTHVLAFRLFDQINVGDILGAMRI